APSQPRKNPVSCQSASSPRQPGMTGSPLKWQEKNHSHCGLPATGSSALTCPLPCAPPSSLISEIRSNISIGGSGSCAFPGPNSSPRPHASKSSYSYVDRLSAIAPCVSPLPIPRLASANQRSARIYHTRLPSKRQTGYASSRFTPEHLQP